MRNRELNREVQFKRLQPLYGETLEATRRMYASWFDTAPPQYQRAALAVQDWLGTRKKESGQCST